MAKNIAGYFNSMVTRKQRRQLLKIAALFHDIAKPLTRIIITRGVSASTTTRPREIR
jgi:hypothetical protein